MSNLRRAVDTMQLNVNGNYSVQDFGGIIQSVFLAWKEAKIEFVVLRNYKGLPNFVGNDLDILVAPGTKEKAGKILIQSARCFNYKLYNRVEFSCTSYFFIDHLGHPLHVDLFSDLTWRGMSFLSPEVVLSNKVNYGLFNIPHPIHEAILNLLTRLLYQGYIRDKYKADICVNFSADRARALTALSDPFGAQLADRIVKDVITEKWKHIESYRKALCKGLLIREITRHPMQFCRNAFSEAVRLTKRYVSPPGIFVVLLGPDGCGKTSLSSRLTKNIAPMLLKDKGLYIHWKPRLLPTKYLPNNVVQVNPHGASPRNAISSFAYFFFHWITFALGSQFQIRPILFNNGLVVVDRYYHDFYIDQQRYRLSVSNKLIHIGQKFILNPNIVLYLDAPAEITQSRKCEVSFEETMRQRNACRNLLDSIDNGYIIDASKSIEEVESQANMAILHYMTQRSAAR